MFTILLPSGDNPIAVNKYIISYTTVRDEVERFLVRGYFHNSPKNLWDNGAVVM
jgi:hypothetical protein